MTLSPSIDQNCSAADVEPEVRSDLRARVGPGEDLDDSDYHTSSGEARPISGPVEIRRFPQLHAVQRITNSLQHSGDETAQYTPYTKKVPANDADRADYHYADVNNLPAKRSRRRARLAKKALAAHSLFRSLTHSFARTHLKWNIR